MVARLFAAMILGIAYGVECYPYYSVQLRGKMMWPLRFGIVALLLMAVAPKVQGDQVFISGKLTDKVVELSQPLDLLFRGDHLVITISNVPSDPSTWVFRLNGRSLQSSYNSKEETASFNCDISHDDPNAVVFQFDDSAEADPVTMKDGPCAVRIANRDPRFQAVLMGAYLLDRFNTTSLRERAHESESADNFAGGIGLNYRLYDQKDPGEIGWQFSIQGRAFFSKRTFEIADSSADSVKMSEVAADTPANTILERSNSFEWYGGIKLQLNLNKDGGVFATGVYGRAELGSIYLEDEVGDLLDNNFYGVGVTHLSGAFAGSFLEVGGGRTDLFNEENRAPRIKVTAHLEYTPQNGRAARTYFIRGSIDSDDADGADYSRLSVGVLFDIGNLFNAIDEMIAGSGHGGEAVGGP